MTEVKTRIVQVPYHAVESYGVNAHQEVRVSFSERVRTVLWNLCVTEPPLEMVQGWLFGIDDERLQEWVLKNREPDMRWAEGIEIIDAATKLADGHVADKHPDKPETKYMTRAEEVVEWYKRQWHQPFEGLVPA